MFWRHFLRLGADVLTMSFDKCKNLLEEVMKELRNSNSSQGRIDNNNELPSVASSTISSGVSSTVSTASASQTLGSNSIHQEHRRLFGYNPRGHARFNPYSRGNRTGQRKSAKPKKVQTWTRQFVCLAKSDQTVPPQLWEYTRLQEAGLGQRKISLDLADSALEVDRKLKEAFPKLESAGGYCLLRTGQGSRILVKANGPYTTEQLKDFMGQGKIFIRPLQKDLKMDAVISTQLEEDLLEQCFNCSKMFYMSELGNHISNCGVNDVPSNCPSDSGDINQHGSDTSSSSTALAAQANVAFPATDHGHSSVDSDTRQTNIFSRNSTSRVHCVNSADIISLISKAETTCSPGPDSCISNSSTVGNNEASIQGPVNAATPDLNQLIQMFPGNDIAFLKGVLDKCGTINMAVAEILGDEERTSFTQECIDDIDEFENIPLAAADIATTDDESALKKFIRDAVQTFGVELNLQLDRQQDVLPQMIRKYKNPSFDITKPLNVEFVGAHERGIDAGGITREYFHFLVESMKRRSADGINLFEGTPGHLVPRHDYELLSSGMFIIAGKMILHALLNNCQGMSGISPAVVNYIITGNRDSAVEDVCLDDIPDPCMKEQLKQLITCNDEELGSLPSADWFSDIMPASGFPFLEITAEKRSLAYECFMVYEVITKRIPALEDIRKGLASVRVRGVTLLDVLRIHPHLRRHVFPQRKDVDVVMLRLSVEFEDTNDEVEKQAQTFLEKYLDDLSKREEESGEETLKDLLLFWTGYPQLPCDTSCKLRVKYSPHQPSKVLAEADTCTVTLRIPTIHQQYEDFRKFFDCSIAHGKVGFGRH